MTSKHDDRTRGGGLLLGAGAVLLMTICCALPVLIAGGMLTGIGGLPFWGSGFVVDVDGAPPITNPVAVRCAPGAERAGVAGQVGEWRAARTLFVLC